MFQNLTKKVNMENLNKIKQQNSKSRYQLQYPQSANERPNGNTPVDSELDQLEVQMQERQENFRKINQLQQAQQDTFLKRDNTTPPNLLKRAQNQLQLLKQQIKLQKNSHQRQLQYQKELYKRREQWLQMQTSKLKLLVKKYRNEQTEVKQMKKDIQQYQQIKQNLQKRIENMQIQNRNMRNIIDKMQKQRLKKQQKETKEILMQGSDRQKINKLSAKVSQMQEDIQYQKRLNQEKKRTIQKLTLQIQRIKQNLLSKEKQFEEYLHKRQQSYCKRQQSLEEQIINLKKRNQYLQETFIQKISQITRLQAHLLSNTSQQSQHQSMSAGARHSRNVQQTINLHEQSPIRPAPQITNYSERKPSIKKNQSKKPTNQSKQDNPQNTKKQNKNKLTLPEGECQCCYKKIQKYKLKLDQANHKIVELIQQKMECIRRSSSKDKDKDKEKYRNLNITYQGFQNHAIRPRITSWNHRMF